MSVSDVISSPRAVVVRTSKALLYCVEPAPQIMHSIIVTTCIITIIIIIIIIIIIFTLPSHHIVISCITVSKQAALIALYLVCGTHSSAAMPGMCSLLATRWLRKGSKHAT
jgi:hypothetical protein